MFLWLGGLHLLTGSKISSDGDAWTATPGFIKLGSAYIDPATGAEKGAAYGLKGAGEDILPSGCTKRIYPSEMREVDAEKNVRSDPRAAASPVLSSPPPQPQHSYGQSLYFSHSCLAGQNVQGGGSVQGLLLGCRCG